MEGVEKPDKVNGILMTQELLQNEMNECNGHSETSQPTWSDLHDAAFSKSDGLQKTLVSCVVQMLRGAL